MPLTYLTAGGCFVFGYPAWLVQKMTSGAQTGADRAALDWAIFRDIEHGGWCPQGRKAEDGKIPPQYQLTETPSATTYSHSKLVISV